MALKKVLLDTNIILYSLVSSDEKAEFIINSNHIFISEITVIEILGYPELNKNEELIIKNLLTSFDIIPINNEVREVAINLRKEYGLKTPDAIICASAVSEGLTFVTADKKLHKIKELDLIKFDL